MLENKSIMCSQGIHKIYSGGFGVFLRLQDATFPLVPEST